MMVLSRDTIDRLNHLKLDRDLMALAEWIHERQPTYFASLGASIEDTQRSALKMFHWAQSAYLHRHRDLRLLMLLTLTQGNFFLEDPRFKKTFWKASRALERSPDDRVLGVYDAFEPWRKDVLQGAEMPELLMRLADGFSDDRLVPEDPSQTNEALAVALPQMRPWLGEQSHSDFVNVLAQDALGRGFPGRGHAVCYGMIATVCGLRWYDDPKFRHIREVFEENNSLNALQSALASRLVGESVT